MTKEALKLALEALEEVVKWYQVRDKNDEPLPVHNQNPEIKASIEAITAIKEALAQPEQEPLEYWNAVEGWVKIDEVREHLDSVGCGTIYKTSGEDRVPLYTTPPKRTWVGLEKSDMPDGADPLFDNPKFIAGMVYAAHKLMEKNNG